MSDVVPVEHQIVVRSLFGNAYAGATADRLVAAAREMFFPAGKVVYEAGDVPKFVHFVLQGRVELVGEGLEPWTFTDRGVFGIIDAELERPHLRTARAVTDVRVIAIRAGDWQDIVEDTFDYTRERITRNSQDLWRRGLELAPHAGFEGMDVDHRADASQETHFDDHEDPFERLLVLHLTDVFERAGIQSLTRLAAGASVTKLAPGEVLVAEGAPAPLLYVVANGLMSGVRNEPRVETKFGLHRLLGGYAGLGQERWPLTMTALETSHVIAISYEDLFDVMEDHFDVVRTVTAFLAAERERLQTFKW